MTSLSRILALAGAIALAATAPVHAKGRVMADGYSRAAEQVLARAHAAAGGASWNILRGWHVVGRQGGAHYEVWVDPLRYGMRVETRDAAGLHVEGFNGQGHWRIAPGGQIVSADDRASVDRARTEAFLAAQGFFYPSRFEAHGELIGVRTAGGRAFDLVNVEPWGGTPQELWFDRQTHLLARIVERAGSPQAVTTEFSDYRAVGPIMVAFHTTVRGPGPAAVQERQVESVVFTPADRALFSLPRPDAATATP